MNFNKISRAIQASHGKGLVLILALLMLVPDIFAQDYTVTLNQRRMGNQIGVEVWIKGASETVDTIANMSLAVTYNTTHLRPADPTSYSAGTTDSVDFNIEQTAPLPYRSITSAFDNTDDYAGLSVTPANNGVDSVSILNVNWGSSQYDGTGGTALETEGKGSFIGIMRFDIIDFNNLGSDEYTGIAFNTATNIGNFVISDTEGEDVEFQTDLTDNYTVVQESNVPVKGIDILNPNGPDEAVNRNKNYESLPIAGYPIYFERSGLVDPTALETYGNTEKLAYKFDYVVNYNESLADENQNWVEFLRVVEDGRDEDDIVADGNTPANYYSGEIVSTTEGTDGFLITQGDGSQILPGSDYGGVLRVIWDDDAFFAERSEEARLRISMLDTTGTTSDIDNRARVDALTNGMSDANFILSRLFFIQLDGANSYLKTQDFDKFDNPSQMTVMAWVNVSSIPSATYSTEPGLVVSSVGPGFDEGAWMLYLKDGQYPAFRARDVKGGGANRGQDGSIFIGTVESPEAFTAQDASVPIDNNPNHTDNWRHVAAVVNLNSISLYVDGELVDKMTNSNANDIRMLDDEQSIWVGINPNETITSDDYLHAGVKEIQIWKEALTQGEIRQFSSGVTNPSTLASGDVRTGLRYYFPINGVNTDEADALPSNSVENDQEGADVLEYFETAPKSSSTVIAVERFPYRPDKSHIRITSPSSFSGVKNLGDVTFPVRFTAFGLGDNLNPSSSDLTLEFSRDGGNTWAYAIDENGALMDDIDIENGTDNWEPYQSATVVGRYNDLQALAPGADTNYSKTVRIRLRGNTANKQSDIVYETEDFVVAPYFSLELEGENNIIEVEDGTSMNLLGGSAVVEAWINPYRLPNDEEMYFPIVNKKDTTVDNNEGLHYSLRVLNTGQVQLAVGQYDSGSNSNTELVATTSENATLIDNANVSSAEDSTWYHIAAYMNLGNGSGNPTVRIYLDGNLLALDTTNSTLMNAENVTVNSNNTYPAYIGFEDRGSSATYNQSFIGEMKRVRYWNGLPDDIAFSSTEPSDLTRFIQGSANIDGAELLEEYQDNLIVSFDFDGTSVLANGKPYNSVFSTINGQDTVSAKVIVNNGVSYKGVQPYVKLVEPVFEQQVKVDEQVYVRWAGFHYDEAGFYTGNQNTSKNSSLEYSAFGGGNSSQAPYEYTASDNTNPVFSDALSLPLTSEYKFPGTNAPNRQFAGILDMGIVKDNEDNTQGPIDAALLNAKLRLRGEATLNAPTAFDYETFTDLRDESELFTITPKSNFTLRVLLEGMHRGASQPMNISDTNGVAQAIGTENFDNGAFRITLYSDQEGVPGNIMATAINDSTYEQVDPNTPSIGVANSDFGNISFVFTDEIADSTYFVLVEHKNHLPVLSRYAAPFFFSGDDEGTWEIESGWDFLSWNGDDNEVLTEANAITTPPTMGVSYSAFGAVESNTILGGTNGFDWSRTGLNYNLGQSGTDTTGGLAAMVAGDIVRDGQINSADAVQARLEAQTSFPDADVTQDGIVNGLDRNIVDRNFGKVWSLEAALDYNEIYNGTSSVRPDDNNPGEFNTLNENDLIASAVYNSVYNSTVEKLDQMKTIEELLLDDVKSNRKQAGGISYNVYKEVEIDEATNIVQVKLYIENQGKEWAMGNSSFAIKYDNDVLQFNRMIDVQNSIWNDVPGLGYFSIYNAPSAQTPNPVSDVTSIEIDYDNRPYFDVEQNKQLKKEGSLVPNAKTLVGTLIFSMRDANAANDFTFEWDRSTVILDIFGRNLTGDGDFDGTDDNSTEVLAELQTPNGGETWLEGNSYFIHWSAPSFAQNIWVELSADRGDTWMRVNQLPVDAADESFKYYVEEIETTEALVRIVDAATGMEIDRSDEVFTITQPKNRITKPAATDQIYIGGQMGVIEWATDLPTNVRFDFSPDGVNNWRTVVPSVDSELGSIEWIIPSEVNTDRAQIVMYDVATGAFLASSEPFRVLAGDLDFTSPDQNTVLAFDVEPIASVEWINNGVTVFDLEFSKDGGKSWETVQTSVNALREQYDWILPSVKTDEAVLRALHQGVEALEYDRTGVFKIDNATSVENGVNFTVGEAFPNPFRESTKIEFSITNPVNVSAELYNAAGLKVATINNGLMSSGSHFLSIDANQLNNSGVYFVKMIIGEEVFVKELVLTK